jgi:hypothetical protein
VSFTPPRCFSSKTPPRARPARILHVPLSRPAGCDSPNRWQ